MIGIEGKTHHVIDIRSVGGHHVIMMMIANREGAHQGMMMVTIVVMTVIHVTVVHVTAVMMIILRLIEENLHVIKEQTIEEIHFLEVVLLPVATIFHEIAIRILVIIIHDLDWIQGADHHVIEKENFQHPIMIVVNITHLQCWAAN